MTSWAVYDATGRLVSVGTVLADPLPDGHTASVIDDADLAAVQAGDADALAALAEGGD